MLGRDRKLAIADEIELKGRRRWQKARCFAVAARTRACLCHEFVISLALAAALPLVAKRVAIAAAKCALRCRCCKRRRDSDEMPGEPHDATLKYATVGVPGTGFRRHYATSRENVRRRNGEKSEQTWMKLKSEPLNYQMLGPPTPQPQAAPHNAYAKWPKATSDN